MMYDACTVSIIPTASAAILQATVVPCVFFLKGSLTLSLKHGENTSSALVANQMAHVIHWLQRNENDNSLG